MEGSQFLNRVFIKHTTEKMKFEQKSKGDELLTWISRGWVYESEDKCKPFCEGKTNILQQGKDVTVTEKE